MNARTCLAALAIAASAACSDDTGILVEVHGDDLQQAVIRLDTLVVLDREHRPDSAGWGSADRRQITVEADLRERPYTVLLRPDGVPNDATVWMAALAYDGNGSVIGFGELDGPVAFTPDLVKRVAMRLRPAQLAAEGCVAKGDHVVVRTTDDCDRDGVTYQTDCDDLDASVLGDEDGDPVVCGEDCDMSRADVYPGNDEVCDGRDNDCDPLSSPPPRMCVQVENEGELRFCRVGQAVCNELGGNTAYGPCAVAAALDTQPNHRVCEKWAACVESGGDDCFVDGRLRCALGFAAPGAPCVPASTELRDLVDATTCAWRLVTPPTTGSWRIGLRPRGSSLQLTSFVDDCDAELVVAAADVVPRLVVLESVAAGSDLKLFSITLEPRLAACDRQQPSELSCRSVGP